MKYLHQILDNKKYIFFIVLLLYIISHKEWFNISSILTSGDWYYQGYNILSTVAIKGLNMWSQDSSFGSPTLDIGMQFPAVIFGFFTKYFGISYALGQRIIWFLAMIFLSIYSSYKLFSYIFQKNSFAVLSAMLLYNFNVYFLIIQISGHMGIAIGYAFMPLLVYSFLKYCDTKNIRDYIYSLLILFLFSLYEPRIAYIGCGMLIVIGIVCKLSPKKVLSYFLLFGLLTAFSLIPIIFGGLYFSNDLTSQRIFGNVFMKLINSIALFHSFWGGGKLEYFSINSIPFYFFIIPLFALLGLLRKKPFQYMYLFFIFTLLGIFLTKQSDYPFTGFYQWAYDHIPLFNLYRESSKFYVILILGYSGMVGFFIKGLFEDGYKKLSLITTIFLVLYSILNLKPLILGEEGGLFKKSIIPEYYNKINAVIEKDEHFSRIAVVPFGTRWIDYSNIHPQLSVGGIVNDEWGDYFKIPSVTYSGNNIHLPFGLPQGENIVSQSLIGYIILRNPDEGDWEKIAYGDYMQNTYSTFKKQTYLKEVNIGSSQIHLFEVDKKLIGEKIQSQNFNSTWVKKHSSMYEGLNKNISETGALIFLEALHPQWKIYLKGENGLSNIPLFENSHSKIYNYANSWEINKGEIISYVQKNYSQELKKQGYPKKLSDGRIDYKYYIENPDGTIDVELTLYFKPQSYFYLGLMISGTTLILLLSYLGYDDVRRRRRKIT